MGEVLECGGRERFCEEGWEGTHFLPCLDTTIMWLTGQTWPLISMQEVRALHDSSLSRQASKQCYTHGFSLLDLIGSSTIPELVRYE